MNKHLLFAVFLSLTIILSLSAISASDVNFADSYDAGLVDYTSEISISGDSDNLLTVEDADSLNDGGDSQVTPSEDATDNSSTVALEDTIKQSDVTKYYKGSTNYTATFADNHGVVLANTLVEIIVDNDARFVETDGNGVVSLDIDLTPGTYKIVAINPSTNYQSTTNFKILSTIKANDISKVRTDARKFSATFLKSNGEVLSNQNVKFEIDGTNYTVKTDKNGVASLSLADLKAGSYIITSYNADGLTKNNTVKVLSSTTSKLETSDYTFAKKNTKQIKVRLLNGLGYAVSGKNIKITINGKTYSKKTDSKGYAYLNLPNLNTGIYTVKYKFNGDSLYKASSSSNTVSIVLSKKYRTVTLKNILDGATKVKSFYSKNSVLPTTVNTGGYKLTIHEFYYLMSKAMSQLSKSKNTQIQGIPGVKAPKSKCSDGVYSAAVTKNKYKAIAKNNVNYIKKNKRVPNYINAVAGKIAYEDYVVMVSRVLDYFNQHKEAPNFVTFISPHKPNFNFKGDNPYGLKGKKVWIDADGGSNAIKLQLAKALKKLGWKVHIGDTYANAHYEDYYNVPPGYVLITIYNGFCAGTTRELASSSVQNLLKTKNVVCVPIWHTAGWNGGMNSYKYGNFNGYYAPKAWDDNFSTKNPAISNVGKFLKTNNIKYCASPTCNLIVKQFVQGGYFASVS